MLFDQADGPKFLAMRVASKPIDHGSLGHYAVAVASGTIAAGLSADSEILQFRWTASTLAVITEVRIDSMNSLGTGFTAGIGQFDLTVARSFSAAGTGGAATTLTGNNNKQRTSMATSSVGEIRMATTAALGTGTKTFDANRLAYNRQNISTATNNVFISSPVYLLAADPSTIQHPLVLAANEGFAVRATVPATGTWSIYLGIRWAEVASY